MTEKTEEKKLLDYATKANLYAELVERCEKHLDKVSPYAARRALASVENAIRHLQEIQKQLAYRMNE
jgi:hypothetical protein